MQEWGGKPNFTHPISRVVIGYWNWPRFLKGREWWNRSDHHFCPCQPPHPSHTHSTDPVWNSGIPEHSRCWVEALLMYSAMLVWVYSCDSVRHESSDSLLSYWTGATAFKFIAFCLLKWIWGCFLLATDCSDLEGDNTFPRFTHL